MLNSYVNSGKKKLVATTLALAITFSSASSASYKLCDSLCLNASATEVEQTQNTSDEIEVLVARLNTIQDEKKRIIQEFDEIIQIFRFLEQEADVLADKAKTMISPRLDRYKERVEEAYNLDDAYRRYLEIECYAINDCFPNETQRYAQDNIVSRVQSYISSAIKEEIGNCKTFSEAEELIEKIRNQAFTDVDKLIPEVYVNKWRLNNKAGTLVLASWFLDSENEKRSNRLEEINKRCQELEEEENQIKQMDKFKKYERKKALWEEFKALDMQHRALQAQRVALEEEYRALDRQCKENLEKIESRVQEIRTEFNELNKDEN